MIVEDKLHTLGLHLPDLEALYRTNLSAAHYISHYAVQNVLYLSGTTPMKDGQPFKHRCAWGRFDHRTRI